MSKLLSKMQEDRQRLEHENKEKIVQKVEQHLRVLMSGQETHRRLK